MAGSKRWAGCGLVAILLLLRAPASHAGNAAADGVEVPGGIAAVARLVGDVDEDPERFIASLNAQLLSATRSDHDWQSIPRRQDLVRFLDLIAELERRFPGRIELDASKDGRRAAERLADTLGFEVAEDRRRGVVLVPKNEGDDDQAFRRMAAQALGFELDGMGDRLNAGEPWAVSLPSDRAPSPLPPELWLRSTGEPMGPRALTTLAQDQRLSLVVAGFDRLSRETRERVGSMDLRWVHDRAPFSFRRYASAFTVENGRLVVPGGDAVLPVWRDVVGAPADAPEGLLRTLLEVDHAKGAYLWHSMRFAPPSAVDYFVGRDAAHGGVLRRLFDRLDESNGAFDSSQSTQPGFETLVRALPIDGDPPHPHLPGGPDLWLAAIEEEVPPSTLAEVEAIARSRAGAGVDETELFLRALTNQVDRLGPDRSALPRLLRGANLFWQHPAIYSPENVVLVTRGSETFAPALSVLDTMDLRSPEVARDYLLTVARLRRLGSDWPQEQLVIAFQGGVEWLRSMAFAGRVDRGLIERELAAWSAIHSRHDTAAAAGPDELGWTVSLLRALPPAPDDAPGRGPLERAMLQALVASTEPRLQWVGLDYDSDRPRLLAAGMAETLDFFEVPVADRLAGLHDALTDLARHCRAEDLDGAKRAAAALRSEVRRLPRPAKLTESVATDAARRIDNPKREVVSALADEFLDRAKAKGLAALEPRIEEATRSLAGDLRPFLAAVAYVVPLAAGRGSLLQDRELVRKHRLVCANPAQDRAWSEATLQRDEVTRPGVSICGHLATVDLAISSFTLSTTQLRTGRGLDDRRAQAWYHQLNATPWHRLEPPLTAAVADVLELGRALLDLAIHEAPAGPHLSLAATVVPRARLERAARTPASALLSPAEAWMIGIAALDRASDDPAISGAGEKLARARNSIGMLGASWRDRLAAVGVPSPALDSRASPTLRWWPPYEAIELDGRNQALIERELVDLHLSIVAYIGRQGLPGFVGSDLMRRTMEDLVSTVELGHERDWESFLRALRRLDDRYFEARLRECLRQGLYRLRES